MNEKKQKLYQPDEEELDLETRASLNKLITILEKESKKSIFDYLPSFMHNKNEMPEFYEMFIKTIIVKHGHILNNDVRVEYVKTGDPNCFPGTVIVTLIISELDEINRGFLTDISSDPLIKDFKIFTDEEYPRSILLKVYLNDSLDSKNYFSLKRVKEKQIPSVNLKEEMLTNCNPITKHIMLFLSKQFLIDRTEKPILLNEISSGRFGGMKIKLLSPINYLSVLHLLVDPHFSDISFKSNGDKIDFKFEIPKGKDKDIFLNLHSSQTFGNIQN